MQRRVTRRHALQAVGTALGASVVSGTAMAQKTASGSADGGGSDTATPTPTAPATGSAFSTVEFDYGGSLDGVSNYAGTTVDARGQPAVKIDVGAEGNGGAFAFDPPAIWIDPGTSVVWNWTGEGGGHSVVADGLFDSGAVTADPETTFSYAPQETGVIEYYCEPHQGLGMKGVVAVGVIEQAADRVTRTATALPDEKTATAAQTPTDEPTESATSTDGTASATTSDTQSTDAVGPGFTALTLGAGALGALGLDRLRE